jgi:hypothetical protein
MTQEIILMADASGISLYGMGKDRAKFIHYLEAFAKLVAEAEREACAKVLESRKTGANELMDAVRDMEARAIRARGQA